MIGARMSTPWWVLLTGSMAFWSLAFFASPVLGQTPADSLTEPDMTAPEGVNSSQQALMDFNKAKRRLSQAEKWDDKAARASSEEERTKLQERGVDAREEALKLFIQSIQLDSSRVDAYVALGDLLLLSGKPQEALQVVEVALERHADSNELLVTRGRAHLGLFQVEEAKADYEDLALLSPEDAGELLGALRSWLEAQRSRLGPEAAKAVADLDRWISEREGTR